MRNVLIGLTLFVLSPLAMAAPLQFGQGPIQPAAKLAAVASGNVLLWETQACGAPAWIARPSAAS